MGALHMAWQPVHMELLRKERPIELSRTELRLPSRPTGTGEVVVLRGRDGLYYAVAGAQTADCAGDTVLATELAFDAERSTPDEKLAAVDALIGQGYQVVDLVPGIVGDQPRASNLRRCGDFLRANAEVKAAWIADLPLRRRRLRVATLLALMRLPPEDLSFWLEEAQAGRARSRDIQNAQKTPNRPADGTVEIGEALAQRLGSSARITATGSKIVIEVRNPADALHRLFTTDELSWN